MGEIMKFESYSAYKQELDNELQKTAEGFVRIGFLLRVARDTNILEGQYENVNEFAKAEYNLDKSMVSRWIQINEEFSQDGCSDILEEKYRGFGWAKLSLMLQLPAALNEELSPNFTKTEIQALRDEVVEESKVSDIERMLEPVPEEVRSVDDVLGKAIVALGKEEPELYYSIHQTACWNHRIDTEKLKDDMAPNEEKIFSIRVPGIGRMMLSLKTDGNNTMTNIRSEEKQEYTWEDIAAAWTIIIDIDKDPKKDWEEQYGEEWPIKEKPEVAPVQQKKEAPKKEKKVQKAKPEKPKPTPKPKEEPKEEPQLPGQDSIMNHPEYMPGDIRYGYQHRNDKIENVTEQSEIVHEIPKNEHEIEGIITNSEENVTNSEENAQIGPENENENTVPHETNTEQRQKEKKEKIKFWMEDFHDNINMAESQAAVGNYEISKTWIKKCLEALDKMESISEEDEQ